MATYQSLNNKDKLRKQLKLLEPYTLNSKANACVDVANSILDEESEFSEGTYKSVLELFKHLHGLPVVE